MHVSFHKSLVNEKLREIAQIGRNELVLDVGAGTGQHKHLLKIENYIGLDISPKPIDKNIQFVKGDFNSLPFKNDSFDCVLLISSLQYAEEPVKVIKELHRVLKKGGKLYACVPYIYPFDHGELWRFSKKCIKTIFEGFEIQSIESIGNRRLIFLMYLIELIPPLNILQSIFRSVIKINLKTKTDIATVYIIKAKKVQ